MIRPIMRDVLFLSQKSKPCTKDDLPLEADLIDTLKAHHDHCVGMAANMIGVNKRAIIFDAGLLPVVMFNPVIIHKDGQYETEEGCLSLDGTRKTIRYQKIEVEYYDRTWKKQKRIFTGWIAQIIQHECDHLEGKII